MRFRTSARTREICREPVPRCQLRATVKRYHDIVGDGGSGNSRASCRAEYPHHRWSRRSAPRAESLLVSVLPDEPAMTPATFKRSIRDLQVWCSSCMVAFSGSDPIGVLIGAKRPSGTLVQKTAVHPDHRRQGHGRHLLASLVIEDGGARLKQLLSRLRVGGITTLRFPKVHPAEISKELLVSRPRNSWRKCRSAAPRWQGATSENIGHI